MKKYMLILLSLMIIALVGASAVSASPDADNVAIENDNGFNVALDASSSVEPVSIDTDSIDEEIHDCADISDSLAVNENLSDNTSETDNVGIADEKTNEQSDIPSTKIKPNNVPIITGPKINASDLNIKGPSLTGSFTELQSQINSAKAGSILYLFMDYKGKKGEVINLNKDLTINGLGNTIDCRGEKNCRAFYSTSGNIILKNLRIINGHNDDTNKGGAIQIMESAKYTIINCTFENNWAEGYGGAIYNGVGKKLTIENCKFIGNTANSVDGGAIYSKGAMDIEDSLFKSNRADEYGGAIACKKNMELLNVDFIGNEARSRDWSWYEYIYHWADNPNCRGGAIYCDADITLYNSLFENNTSEDYAGAIWANNININPNQGRPDKPNTIFINNTAESNNGGAIYANQSLTALNTLFLLNEAKVDGGAIFAWSKVNVTNCNFRYNQACGAKTAQCCGGAIRCKEDYDSKGNVYVEDCQFTGNYAYDYGGAIYADNIYINDKKSNDGNITTLFKENLVKDNDGGALYAANEVTAKNTGFYKNVAYVDGGGIFAKGTVNVSGCEFDGNTAKNATTTTGGGGIYCKSSVNVENSTFANNNAKLGPAIYAIENININQNSNGKNYWSHFSNNKASYAENQNQIVCDKDHGKIKYQNTDFS